MISEGELGEEEVRGRGEREREGWRGWARGETEGRGPGTVSIKELVLE